VLRELCGRRIIAILLCGRGTFACSVARGALQAGRRHVMAPPPLSITQASRRRHASRLATVDPHEHGTVWPLRPVDRPAQAPGDLVTLQENSSPSTPPPTATGALITSGNRPPLLRHLQPHDATLPLNPPTPPQPADATTTSAAPPHWRGPRHEQQQWGHYQKRGSKAAPTLGGASVSTVTCISLRAGAGFKPSATQQNGCRPHCEGWVEREPRARRGRPAGS